VDAEGEHPFPAMKLIFDFTHILYHGIAMNRERYKALCACQSLYQTPFFGNAFLLEKQIASAGTKGSLYCKEN
jgi:hypothetical protein